MSIWINRFTYEKEKRIMKNEDYDKGYRKGHETGKALKVFKNLGKALVYGSLALVTVGLYVLNAKSGNTGPQNG